MPTIERRADPDGAVYAPGAFELALGALKAEPRVIEAFRTGSGIGWHEHDDEVFSGCERFFRPGYAANLVSGWLLAFDGVEAKLHAGARVADIGCGHGASTALMARAYPNSTFTGSDYHEDSVIRAPKQIAEQGLDSQVRFEVASAQTFNGGPYDLVTSFDCVHDMGDPLGAARHIRQMLAPDGTWMVVEPAARATPWPTTSTRSAGSTTPSRPSCASRTRCPRTAATPSAPRPARAVRRPARQRRRVHPSRWPLKPPSTSSMKSARRPSGAGPVRPGRAAAVRDANFRTAPRGRTRDRPPRQGSPVPGHDRLAGRRRGADIGPR